MRTESALQPRAVKFGTSKPMNSGQSPPDLGRAPGFQSAGYNTTQDDHDGRIPGTNVDGGGGCEGAGGSEIEEIKEAEYLRGVKRKRGRDVG